MFAPEAAEWRGLAPESLHASGSAPASRSLVSKHGSVLKRADQWRGVDPCSSRSFGSAPAARQASTSSTLAVSKNARVFQPSQSVSWFIATLLASGRSVRSCRSVGTSVPIQGNGDGWNWSGSRHHASGVPRPNMSDVPPKSCSTTGAASPAKARSPPRIARTCPSASRQIPTACRSPVPPAHAPPHDPTHTRTPRSSPPRRARAPPWCASSRCATCPGSRSDRSTWSRPDRRRARA